MPMITHNSTDQQFEANLKRLLELQKERQSLLNMIKVLNHADTSNFLEISLKSFQMSEVYENVIDMDCETDHTMNDTDEIFEWSNLLTNFINTRLVIIETEIKLLMV